MPTEAVKKNEDLVVGEIKRGAVVLCNKKDTIATKYERKAVILNAEHSGVVLDDKKDLVIFSSENGAVVVNVKEEETFNNAAVPAMRKVDKKDLGNAGGAGATKRHFQGMCIP